VSARHRAPTPEELAPYVMVTWYGTEGAGQREDFPPERMTEAVARYETLRRDSWCSAVRLSVVTPLLVAP
jgi:hypothetical protein